MSKNGKIPGHEYSKVPAGEVHIAQPSRHVTESLVTEQGGLEPHAHPTDIRVDMGQLPTDGNFPLVANQIKTSIFHFDKKILNLWNFIMSNLL